MSMKLPAWTKKLPKKVTAYGKTGTIEYNMNYGCSLSTDDATIILVGCAAGKDSAIEGLVHEISEWIHIELRQRFTRGPGV
jgi:hypothetical protein